jgi:hypothetical protein
MSNEIKNSIDSLSKNMKYDEAYAMSWLDNISMSMQDAGCGRDVANEGASRFMKLAFNIDITKE